MGKFSNYKKLPKLNSCYWCDYLTCRKGHKCSTYKKHAKKFKQKDRKTRRLDDVDQKSE